MGQSERTVLADDGVALWTVRTGPDDGVPAVLCHGGPGLWDELAPLAAMMDDVAPVVRWDQRGAGRSDAAGPFSITRSIADLECVREAVGVERWIVGGHSWGAGLALRYAMDHPSRVSALLYVSGTDLGWPRHAERYHAERLRRLGHQRLRWEELRRGDRTPVEDTEFDLLTWSTDFADRERAVELARQWGYDRYPINREANAVIGAEVKAEREDSLRARCRTLRAPCLVVHGDGDPRPLEGPRDLAAELPNAQLVVLPGVGHVPWAERPELLRRALRAFLRRLPSGPTVDAGRS